MAAAAEAVDGGTYSGGGAGWVRRRQQEPSRYLQQPDVFMLRQQQQGRQPSSASGGNEGIASALARLQHGSRPGPSYDVQRHVLPERRNLSGDVNENAHTCSGSGGGSAGGQNRSHPRPFVQSHDRRGMRYAREATGKDSQRSRESESEAVRVAVRVRPMSEREVAADLQRIVSVDSEETLSVVDPTAFAAALVLERSGQEQVESSMWAKQFSFDRCFGCNEDDRGGGQQEQVFEEIGAGVIDQAFSGYNATVFAYGQTGSGKSYTMMGSGAALDARVDPDDHGLIPRICAGIFERLHQGRGRGGSLFCGADGATSCNNSSKNYNHNDNNSENAIYNGINGDESRPPGVAESLTEKISASVATTASAASGSAADADPLGFPAAGSDPDPSATWTHCSVEVSYLEIYNESLRDLFNPGTPTAANSGSGGVSQGIGGPGVSVSGSGSSGTGLRLREDPSSGTYVEGLTSIAVSSWDEMSQLLTYGGGERTVAATNANDWSSRSHAVFTLTFRQASEVVSLTGHSCESWEACSSVNLVDLAGSERVSHTGATGLRLQEAGSINRSLAALSDVIKALSEAQRRQRDGRSPGRQLSPGRGKRGGVAAAASVVSPKAFIPYRNSVLTRLLKESLGGNSRTVMLACVSPCDAHYEETLGTLRYAERAKRVKTRAIANARRGVSQREAAIDQAALVGRLTTQILDLKRRLVEATTNNATALLSPQPAPALTPAQPPSLGSRSAIEEIEHPGAQGRLSPVELPVVQATAGAPGYIYVVDPALQVEIERLRDTVADRERVIQNMETEGRRNPRGASRSSTEIGGARSTKRDEGGGDVVAAGTRVTSSHLSSDGSCSSPSSLDASARPSIPAPPREPLEGVLRASKCTGVRQVNRRSVDGDERESGMRLLNLNQDPMFSECISFRIRDGGMCTVVGSGEDADIRLVGGGILPRHAIIKLEPDGTAVLTPMPGACVRVNGVLVSADAEASPGKECDMDSAVSPAVVGSEKDGGVLDQDYRVLFGSRHFFRVDCGQTNSPTPGKDGAGGVLADEIISEASPRAGIDWDFAQKELRDNILKTSSSDSNNIKTEDTLVPPSSSSTAPTTVEGILTSAATCVPVNEGSTETEKTPSEKTPHAQNCGEDEGPASERQSSAASDEDLQESDMLVAERAESVVPTTTLSENKPPCDTQTPPKVMLQLEPPATTGTSLPSESRSCSKHPPSPVPLSDPSLEVVGTAKVGAGEGGRQKIADGTPPCRGGTVESPTSAADDSVGGCAESQSSTGLSCGETTAMATSAKETSTSLHRDNGSNGVEVTAAERRLPTTPNAMEGRDIIRPSSPKNEEAQEDGRLDSAPREQTPPRSPVTKGTTMAACCDAAATAVYAHKVKTALDIELQRAREAWRGAEGELERSQEERDELRAALQVVQDQARDRRRADRKEKRDLDKLKAQAEYRARALEADRDRLRQMLSKSDEEVADLRGQLREARAAATAVTATTTAGTTASAATQSHISTIGSAPPPEQPTVGTLSTVETVSPGSGSEPSTPTPTPRAEAMAERRASSIGRWQATGVGANSGADPDGKGGDRNGDKPEVQRPSTVSFIPGDEKAAFEEMKQESSENVGGGEDLGYPASRALVEGTHHGNGSADSAVVRDEPEPADLDKLWKGQGVPQQQQQQYHGRTTSRRGSASEHPPKEYSRLEEDVQAGTVGRILVTPSETAESVRNSTALEDHVLNVAVLQNEVAPLLWHPQAPRRGRSPRMKGLGKDEIGRSGTYDSTRRDERRQGGGWESNDLSAIEGSDKGPLASAAASRSDADGASSHRWEGAKQAPTPKQTKPHRGDAESYSNQRGVQVEPFPRKTGRHSVQATSDVTEGNAGRTATPGDGRIPDSVAARQPRSGAIGVTLDIAAEPIPEAAVERAATLSAPKVPGRPAAPSTGGVTSQHGTLPRFTDEADAVTFPPEATRARVGGSSGGGGRRRKSGTTPARTFHGEAGDFYRAALSTHLSFIATTEADDVPRPSGSTRGENVGGGSEGKGVGEACRVLQGDVAGVRQRLEAVQSKFFQGASEPSRAKELSS